MATKNLGAAAARGRAVGIGQQELLSVKRNLGLNLPNLLGAVSLAGLSSKFLH